MSLFLSNVSLASLSQKIELRSILWSLKRCSPDPLHSLSLKRQCSQALLWSLSKDAAPTLYNVSLSLKRKSSQALWLSLSKDAAPTFRGRGIFQVDGSRQIRIH
ncbi:hypothetical protein AMTRI_Chr05g71510 [Amborella trichopoda]